MLRREDERLVRLPKATARVALTRERRLLWSAAALIGSIAALLVGAAASATVSHKSRPRPFPRPIGPARTVAAIRTLRTHRLIVLQVWPGPTGRGTTLITPGGISRSCCGEPPKPTELSVHPEQIGTLPRPGMLLLWGAVGARIRTVQLRFEDKTQQSVPIHNRFTLYQVSPGNLIRGHRPVELIGRNRSGLIVTTQRIGPFPR
jgi:hypothetical protein